LYVCEFRELHYFSGFIFYYRTVKACNFDCTEACLMKQSLIVMVIINGHMDECTLNALTKVQIALGFASGELTCLAGKNSCEKYSAITGIESRTLGFNC